MDLLKWIELHKCKEAPKKIVYDPNSKQYLALCKCKMAYTDEDVRKYNLKVPGNESRPREILTPKD